MLQLALEPYTLHFARPAATSRGALTQRSILLLRAWHSEEPSILGWGECGPIPNLSRDDRPTFYDEVAEVCGVINAGYLPAPPDLAHLPSFAFGLEMALRDLAGGGKQRLWDTPFTRHERGLPTHGLIWMDTPEGLLQQIEAKIAAGFTVVKMKVGALPLAQELTLLAIVRSSYPAYHLEVRLDANGAFAPEAALPALEQFARFDIAFLEQPLPAGNWAQTAALCRQSPIPIALDEELIPVTDLAGRQRLLDVIQPQHLILKPALLGGFTVADGWIVDAQARGIQWWANSLLESNLGLNAICQWISAAGGSRTHGLGTGGLFTNNFPSPLHLLGSQLVYAANSQWKLPQFSLVSPL